MRQVIMIGPSLQARGGVASVISVYKRAGLFEQWPVRYLVTTVDGGNWIKAKTAMFALAQFAGLLISGQQLLLHAHTGARTSFWRKFPFFLLAISFRQPFIFHLHDGGFSDFFWQECGRTKQALVRFILKRASKIVVLTTAWQTLISQITENKNVSIIVNPVPIPESTTPVQNRDRYSILYLGGGAKSKGIFDLLEAIRMLAQDFPSLQLICGGIGDMNAIERRAAELGITKHIRAIGWIENKEKSILLCSATVYTLPSYHEGLPMGLLEAMAAGLPVVVTKVGGMPDVVTDGKEGILVEPGDVHALHCALRHLLSAPEIAGQMGLAARATAITLYSPQNVVPKLKQVYGEFGIQRI
jgi:glycosyltransferase involved in cell wall biosynthesis